MAIMRTSEKNCDVYVYHDGKKYNTHVKVAEEDPNYDGPPPLPLEQLVGKSDEFIMKDMDKGLRSFDNPHAGKDFFHDTAQECLDNLLSLQKDGVKLSESGIEILKAYAAKGE